MTDDPRRTRFTFLLPGILRGIVGCEAVKCRGVAVTTPGVDATTGG